MLTKEQLQTNCANLAKNKKNDKGECPIPDAPNIQGCTTYCEESIRFFYGQELPFTKNIFGANQPATITNADTVTITKTWTIGGDVTFGKLPLGDVEAAVKFGASYSWSEAFASTLSTSVGRPKDDERRGRFTAIPIMYE
jgi:hypothetical protein